MSPHDKEALRQQMLLRALLGDARPAVVGGWLRSPAHGPTAARGLAAYRANAGALAERALAAAYPTLQQLLGEESFAGLARHFWRQQPPVAGDITLWGEGLADFMAAAPTLAGEPYLADVARLEWAVHMASAAADAGPPQGLDRLAEHDPAALLLRLAPGTALIVSAFPVVCIWQAHRAMAGAGASDGASDGDGDDGDTRLPAVRTAFAAGQGETALVARHGWAPVVRALGAAEANFTAAVLAGRPLAEALQAGGDRFDFESWLVAALQQQWLAAVDATAGPAST